MAMVQTEGKKHFLFRERTTEAFAVGAAFLCAAFAPALIRNPLWGGAASVLATQAAFLATHSAGVIPGLYRGNVRAIFSGAGPFYKAHRLAVPLVTAMAVVWAGGVAATKQRAHNWRAEQARIQALPRLEDNALVPASLLRKNICEEQPDRPVPVKVNGKEFRYSCAP